MLFAVSARSVVVGANDCCASVARTGKTDKTRMAQGIRELIVGAAPIRRGEQPDHEAFLISFDHHKRVAFCRHFFLPLSAPNQPTCRKMEGQLPLSCSFPYIHTASTARPMYHQEQQKPRTVVPAKF